MFFNTTYPIIDLHCDMLLYLATESSRTPYDLCVRCAIPQMQKGNVKVQTMAIFTMTEKGSTKKGLQQAEIFKMLPKQYPRVFERLHHQNQLAFQNTSATIAIVAAFENASGFCEEADDLESALKELTILQHKIGKLAYISLTWNTENRFGGGAHTSLGLKKDGEKLIDYMSEYHIGVDLSHASDALAYDIFNYLDKKNYSPPVLASHSNMRTIVNVTRNLPDDIVKEIVRRKGIIGLNFINHFIGESTPNNFIKHLEHLLLLKANNHIGFGADFYCEEDLPLAYRRPNGSFFQDFGSASTYPNLISLWKKHLPLSESTFQQICFNNGAEFLKHLVD